MYHETLCTLPPAGGGITGGGAYKGLGKIKIEIYGMRRVHAAQEEKYIKIILAKE
jgi:hypothetical protein